MPKADELFQEFQEHSVAEFFKKNKQMLGYSGKLRSLTTIVHEYITNSLDACEDAGILPEIKIRLERLGKSHYKVTVKDNGPGIPQAHVGKVFAKMLAGTKFHRFVQSRGQQGIGCTGCTLYSQMTTGKPTHITTSTGKNEKVREMDIMIDVKKNHPKITNKKEYRGEFTGTKAEAKFKDVSFNRSQYGAGEYIRRTALANPHAKVTFIDPDNNKIEYDRVVSVVPPVPQPSKPHPKGITVDDMLGYSSKTKSRTIRSFLVKSFDRMSNKKAKELEDLVSFNFKQSPGSMGWEQAEELIDAIKKTDFMAPSTKNLYPIKESRVKKAILNVLDPEYHDVVTRDPVAYRGGVPFIVEAGIAYGGDAGRETNNGETRSEILRFANRSPLLFDKGAGVISKVVDEIEWRRYELKKIENQPVSIFVNVSSTYVPYTSAGKQAIADIEEVHDEIKLALMEVGRKVKKHLKSKRRKKRKYNKKKKLLKYAPEVAEAVSEITGENEETLKNKLLDEINEKYGGISKGDLK